MLQTAQEHQQAIGRAIRARRVGQNWSQAEAARRAGMNARTWGRMERLGQATIENLVNAAIALRCEDQLKLLFPLPRARSMDELLQQQSAAESAQHQRKRPTRRAKPW